MRTQKMTARTPPTMAIGEGSNARLRGIGATLADPAS